MSQLAIPNNFFGILLFGPFYECIAVSATPDPLGAYYRYQYSFDKLNDYPKMGVWPDGYYMTMNQYTALSLQWAGQGVVAFDRAKMLAGPAGFGDLLRPWAGRHESCRHASRRSRWTGAARRVAPAYFAQDRRRRVGGDADRSAADLEVPHRLDDAVSVVLYSCRRRSDGAIRFRICVATRETA